MLTIVHGADIVSSRKYFIEQKNKNSLTFDSADLVLSELEQSLSGSSLFGQGKTIFIENLFTKKASKNFEPIATVLHKISNETSVFLWADKELGIKPLSAFPKHTSQLYKINQNIFGFLDSIKSNSSQNVANFHEALKFSDSEIIFFMIIRQFRLMLGIIDEGKDTIDEVKRLAPWQRSKLMRQSQLFGKENLIKIYKKIYKIDKQQKTGRTILTLVQNIDILLLEI